MMENNLPYVTWLMRKVLDLWNIIGLLYSQKSNPSAKDDLRYFTFQWICKVCNRFITSSLPGDKSALHLKKKN